MPRWIVPGQEILCKQTVILVGLSGILLEPPRGKMLSTLGECAFQAAALHLWNELPLQLRTIESVETFKNSIKTFLFKQFFQ